jgi:predicted nuclease with TOPRIM domain
MTDGNQNGWNEYSKLVLKELETLSSNIEGLKEEIQNVKQEMTKLQVREDKIEEVRDWKGKIDEVASPTQLKEYLKKIDDLETFKTKAVTIFAVVQFLMAVAVAATKVFG